jgi:hypothetical protein
MPILKRSLLLQFDGKLRNHALSFSNYRRDAPRLEASLIGSPMVPSIPPYRPMIVPGGVIHHLHQSSSTTGPIPIWPLALYGICLLISWVVCARLLYLDDMGFDKSIGLATNRIRRRQNLGMAVALSFLLALFWPLGLPMAICITGFAKHGFISFRDGEI